ncbi:rhomboid-like protein [Streptomyces sp. NPDC018055]|uniref:rhomboid-like protein n=1 Tax=Streptomyces sp. NPDC018055 TaxID=3365038 RepID=UPI0037B6EA22
MPREQPGPTADGNGNSADRPTTDGHRHREPARPTDDHRNEHRDPEHARATARRWATAVRRWIATAPGTYSWLAILLVTTVVLHRMSPAFEEEFLRDRSTNLHELSQNPLRVLVASALWIDGGRWLPYAVLFTVFHATAEHWLGTLRWLAVAVTAHVVATLVSEGVLAWAIRHDHAPQSAATTLDVGVSYALAGVVAVLTYRVPHPWRYVYVFAVLVVYGIPLAADGRTVTDLGHFTAVLTGLACYPLTRNARERGGTKHPAAQ